MNPSFHTVSILINLAFLRRLNTLNLKRVRNPSGQRLGLPRTGARHAAVPRP
jgi:hypothetical protein